MSETSDYDVYCPFCGAAFGGYVPELFLRGKDTAHPECESCEREFIIRAETIFIAEKPREHHV